MPTDVKDKMKDKAKPKPGPEVDVEDVPDDFDGDDLPPEGAGDEGVDDLGGDDLGNDGLDDGMGDDDLDGGLPPDLGDDVEVGPDDMSGGEINPNDEPMGSKVLRRLHADSSHLLQEYDSWMGALEHPEVRDHLQQICEVLEKLLSGTEKHHSKHYGHLSPLDGGMGDKGMEDDIPPGIDAEDELPPEEGGQEELAGDDVEASGDADEAGDDAEPEGEFNAGAEDTGTDDEDLPPEEEAVEAMSPQNTKKQMKGRGKALDKEPTCECGGGCKPCSTCCAKANKKDKALCNCGKKSCGYCGKKSVQVPTSETNNKIPPARWYPGEGAISSKSLAPHEAGCVKAATAFLSKLTDDNSKLTDLDKLDCWHFHKSLAAIGRKGGTDDLVEEVQSGEHSDDPTLINTGTTTGPANASLLPAEVGEAARFFKELALTKAFGDPHRRAAKMHQSALGEWMNKDHLPGEDDEDQDEEVDEELDDQELVEKETDDSDPDFVPGEVSTKSLAEEQEGIASSLRSLHQTLANLTSRLN